MKNRIYGEKVSVSQEDIKAFWDCRATMFDEKGPSAVICGNQDSVIAHQENEFDREKILPQLKLTRDSRVLDIGCGVGRVAEMILPQCGFYCGVDYSENMLQVTERVCSETLKNTASCSTYRLHHLSFKETVDKTPEFFGGPFDALIMIAVCGYVNDEELEMSFKQLPQLLSDNAVIWMQESMGLEQRLTLDKFESKDLQTRYSSIYRTREEYMQLYAPLFEAGFVIVEEAQFPNFGNAYADSERRFCIMKRG